MMISRIPSIKSYGVFSDFKWPSTLSAFRHYNLFYGWNYSGKTTLSRVFRCAEGGVDNPDFPGATFQFQDDGGNIFGTNGAPAGIQFRVFNTDYVRENLKFDSGDANPILYLGTKDISRKQELSEKQGELARLQSELQRAEQERTTLRALLDTKLTKQAREIKTDLSIPTYDRTKFETRVKTCIDTGEPQVMSSDERAQALAIARSTDRRAPLAVKTNSFRSLDTLRSKITAALQREIVKAVPISRLSNRPEVEQWAQRGRHLHEHEGDCLFCGQPLPGNLLKELRLHFSAEYDGLMADIRGLIDEVDAALGQVANLDDSGVFYPELAQEYLKEKQALDTLLELRRDNLNEWRELLLERQSNAFSPILIDDQKSDYSPDIKQVLDRVNTIIAKHNGRTADFETNKREAIDSLESDYACQFAIKEDYGGRQAEIARCDNVASSIRKSIRDCQAAIQEYERDLSAPNEGAEVINELLQAYFGHSSIQIVVTDEQRYQILRDGTVARNLSEGEQTAICFSYFLARVVDGRHPVGDTIVVIDDPISSLDSSHLFNTYALIKTKLAGVRQLFMFTHSFEFFVLLRTWLEKGKDEEWGAYLIRRADHRNSRIEELPSVLRRFRSEYHYLFQKLYVFDQSSATDIDLDLSMPNVVRRFLEAFAGVMIPSSIGLYKKMERLFADEVERERVFKFINDFSHNTTMIRSLTIPDTSECRSVVRSCLAAVKNWDSRYYEDLENEVK